MAVMEQNPAATLIDRELTRRLLAGSTPNRLLSLTLFPLFGFFYGNATPWPALAAPFARAPPLAFARADPSPAALPAIMPFAVTASEPAPFAAPPTRQRESPPP